MNYFVKHTYIATAKHPNVKEGTRRVWYVGKGGDYVDQDLRFLTGWKRRAFAEKYIEKDKAWYAEHPNDAWENEWSIITTA